MEELIFEYSLPKERRKKGETLEAYRLLHVPQKDPTIEFSIISEEFDALLASRSFEELRDFLMTRGEKVERGQVPYDHLVQGKFYQTKKGESIYVGIRKLERGQT